MASSTPIYKAYVGVIPTAKGFGKSLEGELGNANLQGAANRAGDSACLLPLLGQQPLAVVSLDS